MADNEVNRHAEAEPAIPQDRPENNQGRYRPENNQGRMGYEVRIRQIMDTRGCSFEHAQRIFGQMCNAARGRRG